MVLEKNNHAIVITGASRGIGAAFARHYAAPSVRLCLIARNEDNLRAVAEECTARGAYVLPVVLDVLDAGPLADALLAFHAQTPVDLLIANAGVSSGQSSAGGIEPADTARHVARVNFEGVVNTIAPLLEPMRRRGAGRIGIVSSIAGLVPLPDSAAYSASKAGVLTYGLALDAGLRPQGVSVTVLCPGYIESDMSARLQGSKPFLMSTEKAVRLMARALEKRRRVYSFPWPMALMARAGELLPLWMRAWILGRFFRFQVERE